MAHRISCFIPVTVSNNNHLSSFLITRRHYQFANAFQTDLQRTVWSLTKYD